MHKYIYIACDILYVYASGFSTVYAIQYIYMHITVEYYYLKNENEYVNNAIKI